MSRPYIKINNLSLATASNILTLDYTAFKLRGGGQMVLTGFGSAKTFTLLQSNKFTDSVTFSSTQSSGTYSVTLSFAPLGGFANYTYRF